MNSMMKKALAVLCTGLVLAVFLSACTKKTDLPASEVISGQVSASEEESSASETGTETVAEGERTFTEIIDGLKAGYGYALVPMKEQDVLLVTDYVFDYEGKNQAIDADVYIYDENGTPRMIGSVKAGGTAYPLGINKGILYVCRNHGITSYKVIDGELIPDKNVEEWYGEDDTITYIYTPADGGQGNSFTPEEIKEIMDSMYREYYEGEIIAFDVIAE